MGPSIEEQRDKIRALNRKDKEEEIEYWKSKRKAIRESKIVEVDRNYRSDGWVKKRNKILLRDRYECKKCGSRKNLVVHHKKYFHGKKLYEISNKYLITWCEKCHNEHHKKYGKNAYEVVYDDKNSKNKRKKNKSSYKSKRKCYKCKKHTFNHR